MAGIVRLRYRLVPSLVGAEFGQQIQILEIIVMVLLVVSLLKESVVRGIRLLLELSIVLG
jgi:hypothetical protein